MPISLGFQNLRLGSKRNVEVDPGKEPMRAEISPNWG
jgi:hypothetical protein